MRRAALLALLVALGCCTTRGHQESPSAREPAVTDDASRAARETAAPPDAPAHAPSAPPEAAPAPAEPPPRLPDGVLVGVAMDVAVPGDSAVRVVHGGAEVRRALVYLHGMCGNPEAMADWSRVAIRYGTLIVLRADVPCGDRPGNKWPTDVNAIQRRIDRALEVVAEQRGGLLDRSRLVAIGYSQGAHRAERLAEAFPDRYPHLVLGGPPTAASPERLERVRSVAILGGELENTDHMRAGALALEEAGLRARFFLLPGVGHGAYGPEAPRILGDVFAWLFAGDSANDRPPTSDLAARGPAAR
jgi:predicted esterase